MDASSGYAARFLRLPIMGRCFCIGFPGLWLGLGAGAGLGSLFQLIRCSQLLIIGNQIKGFNGLTLL